MDQNLRLYYRTAKSNDLPSIFTLLKMEIYPIIEHNNDREDHSKLNALFVGHQQIEFEGEKVLQGFDVMYDLIPCLLRLSPHDDSIEFHHPLGGVWELPRGESWKILLTLNK